MSGCAVCDCMFREVIEALTGIMIWLQRRLVLVLAQVLVQIGVQAFVVILRMIHGERMISSELDVCVVEYSISECQ